jgi:hypothetical protein
MPKSTRIDRDEILRRGWRQRIVGEKELWSAPYGYARGRLRTLAEAMAEERRRDAAGESDDQLLLGGG